MFKSPVYHSRMHKSPVYRSMPGIVAAGEVSTGALSFDGTNDYVDCGIDSSLDTPTAFTWSFWASNSSSGVRPDWAPFNKNGLTGYMLWWLPGAGPTYRVYTNGVTRLDFGGSITTDAWHYIAVTWTGTTLTGYVDGVYRNSVAYAIAPNSAGGAFEIGRYVGTREMTGKLDDVRIYNRDLSAAEILAMYVNETPAPTNGLVGHWKFDEGSGTTAADSSGNGNNGTLTNGPTWTTDVPAQLA